MEESYRAMLEGGERLGRAASLTEVMLQLARLMKKVLGCRLVLCYELPGDCRQFLPVGWSGLAPRSVPIFLQHPLLLKDLPLLEEMVRRRRRLLVSGQLQPGFLPPELGEIIPRCTLLAIPLQVRGEVVGLALALRDIPFDHEEGALLGWTGSHAALALASLSAGERVPAGSRAVIESGKTDRLELYSRSQSMFVNTVSSLVKAIEAKSRWTRGHSERVMRTCVIIAAAMGLGEAEVERVRLGGLLHDIGKIGVEGVLDNPGLLHAEEGPPLKLHPEMGVAILSPISELKPVLPGILHHHERFDGTGYPAGLRGDQIPLDARIIAVADAFDAIVSERPYKSGSGHADALVELKICAGSQFDPEVVRSLSGFVTREGREAPAPDP
ncbi:MAG: hypothetical protein A2075_23150 [Geobacteraceae bacterium GWC2_58_44]|nr:MAG: hypothetical protein A2075_23150 [Geobacteraceae bacterium GWC2_58_44]